MYRKFRMSFDYEYIINDGAVICFATPNKQEDTIDKYTRIYATATAIITQRTPKPLPSPYKTYKGIARLKEGDINDIAAAKNIARDKAYRAALKGFRNYTNTFFDFIMNIATDCVEFGNTIEDKIDEAQGNIDELIS